MACKKGQEERMPAQVKQTDPVQPMFQFTVTFSVTLDFMDV